MSIQAKIVQALVALCCLVAVPPSAFAQPAAPTSEPMQSTISTSAVEPPDRKYILGPDDVVEIEVLGRSDFHVRAKLGADGKIQLPYLGDFEAANRTARELGDHIAKALEAGGYFQNPVMRVEIVGYASRYAVVLGAVGSPGLVPINRAYRLSEIIARVGGIRADGADKITIRPENGAERQITVNDMATGDETKDPYVSAGDKIYVPTAPVFYISGQVKAPGSYPLNSEMTFRMAIARGGGLTDMGSEKRVKVTRDGEELGKVSLDSKVLPGDIVVIGERLF
jgi:polysaccharide export outer membrane protein